VLEWLHHKNGWPSQYPDGDMPADVAIGFQYLLRTEKASSQGIEELQSAIMHENEHFLRLQKQSFGN